MAEIRSKHKHVRAPWRWRMPANPAKADSQMYIIAGAAPDHSNGEYTVFGQVICGMDVVRRSRTDQATVVRKSLTVKLV